MDTQIDDVGPSIRKEEYCTTEDVMVLRVQENAWNAVDKGKRDRKECSILEKTLYLNIVFVCVSGIESELSVIAEL